MPVAIRFYNGFLTLKEPISNFFITSNHKATEKQRLYQFTREQSLKNDLPLSVSMGRPRTGGHPSKYWPSEKLLDLGDRLAPHTYYTPNTVGWFINN